ncbi:MAG: phage integrase N-terminal SAM-like domain-containing protein [Thermodesulfobacteriota bacterium]|nr:phage integrase N-terminal SAM-like domain-containing protein [Thermodesulfobacteriota bacterium]
MVGKADPGGGFFNIKIFLIHLAVERKVAASTQNQAFSALLFLYRKVWGKNFVDLRNTIRVKQSKRIPVALTKDEIKKSLTICRVRIAL